MKRIILLAVAALMTLSAVAASPQKVKKVKEVKEVTFSVHLHCENCVKKVQENISFEKGVKGLDVCQGHQTVTVKYDPAKTSEETLKAAIEKLGYEVSGVVAPEEVQHHDH
jgi:copper chaperone CopZ